MNDHRKTVDRCLSPDETIFTQVLSFSNAFGSDEEEMTTNFRFVFLKSFTSGRLLKTKPGDELRNPLRMRNRIFVMSR